MPPSAAFTVKAKIRRRQQLLTTGALQNAIFNSANFSSIATDARGVIQIFNVGAERMLGYAAVDVVNKITPADISDPIELIARAKALSAELGTPISSGFEALVFKASRGIEDIYELTYVRQDGSRFEAVVSVTALRDTQSRIIGYLLIGTDNTARKQVREKLRVSDLALKAVTQGVLITRPDGCIVQTNDAFSAITGYAESEVLGRNCSFLQGALTDPDTVQAIREALNTLTDFSGELLNYRKDGTLFWNELTISPVRDEQAHPSHFIGTLRDITERKQEEEKLQLAANVFTHAREGIMITDADGRIIDTNDAFTRITSYGRAEVLGRNPRILSSGLQDKSFYVSLWRDLTEKGHWYGEMWNRRSSGEAYAVMQNISAVRDARGHISQYVTLFSDITALKAHESQLEHIAHYDALTSLPNRVLFADRLQQAMVQAQRRGLLLSVVYLDLDGFKAINDKHGHEAGDKLLMALAARMTQTLREGDTLARLGGDEFVAILLDLADVGACEKMLTRLLFAAAQPVRVGELTLQVTVSIGVTFYPQPQDIEADQLLRQADQAMYQAKLAGKNRYHAFDAAQDSSARDRHQSLRQIRRALSEGEFVLHYQPKVNMRTGKVIGVEALIRWQHPTEGLLWPAAFLPLIEDHPLAVELGEWVIATALTQHDRWQAEGLNIPVSVNVGARQLQQADFVERLRALLAGHPGIRPDDLELEVLETSALEDLAKTSLVIDACREIGVKFALDDFGTGYSSLTYLKRLSVSQLKIDQSFVRGMLDDPDDLAILDGVLGLATAFRRQVLAEGVETVEHGEMLLQLGCELAQGYGIARPMPAADFPRWASAWHPDPAWVNRPAVKRDDLPLLFASAEHRAWVTALRNYLTEERSKPPSLDLRECRFSEWLLGQSVKAMHSIEAIASAQASVQAVYATAAELYDLKDQGCAAELCSKLLELHALSTLLMQQVKVMGQTGKH